MNKSHKHAELIKAWADGAKIEIYSDMMKEWVFIASPSWYIDMEYRIKPEPKPDLVAYLGIDQDEISESIISEGSIEITGGIYMTASDIARCPVKLKLVFDGETGKLKSAEVL